MNLVVTVWLIICAWCDWRSRVVSNWLTMPALVVSVIWAIWNWNSTMLLCFLTSLIMVVLWIKGGTSGADAKIMIALSSLWPLGLLFSAVITAIITLVVIKTKGRGETYPAVLPIAVGAIIALVVEKIWLLA